VPELAEVETVCRMMRRTLVGKRITEVEAVPDKIVFGPHSRAELGAALSGRVVRAVGRRGKTFWLEMKGEGPMLFGHLGMEGWVEPIAGDERPRFWKLALKAGTKGVAFTDSRRLGRLWLGESPEADKRVARLGRDAHDDLPTLAELTAMFARRNIPIKAVLLDQGALAGIGNWLADEILYQSRIAPKRVASSLGKREVAALRRATVAVIGHAVDVGADHGRFPKTWLFEHRWGGSRGSQRIGRHAIVREEVGGRTTAWVPAVQK
jgi:formamidopyrimidine-DNA glycosylase